MTQEKSRNRRPGGPGWIVAAAFIGPGTVTTATVAGAKFGPILLWALVFSVLATIALQEMAARLGLVTGQGLGEAIRGQFTGRVPRIAVVVVVVGAIAVGNAAYQTGNLLGAGLGIQGLIGGPVEGWAVAIAALAFGLLWTGSYRVVEGALTGMVAVMGAAFLATALAVGADVAEVVRGSLVPTLPGGSIALVLALVGTTVVPYNLFLHATAVGERWTGEAHLPRARLDLTLSIAIGGVVSMAILVTAAGTIHGSGSEVSSAADMAPQLEPLLGKWARAVFGVGLFAAGMTSAITAPLAAAWATAGSMGWGRDLTDLRMRAVWIGVLSTGALLAATGVRPVPAILFAQMTNGLLLPAVAAFLLLAVNDRARLGRRANGLPANLVGIGVVAVALVLGGRAILGALRLI